MATLVSMFVNSERNRTTGRGAYQWPQAVRIQLTERGRVGTLEATALGQVNASFPLETSAYRQAALAHLAAIIAELPGVSTDTCWASLTGRPWADNNVHRYQHLDHPEDSLGVWHL
jgi:hypothetical protein